MRSSCSFSPVRAAIGVAVLLAGAAGAWGQVTYDAQASYSYGYSSIDMQLVWDGNSVVPTTTTTATGMTMTLDATVIPRLENNPTSAAWSLTGYQSFRVGPVPVEASLAMLVNGKLVNGGGDADQPTTGLSWSATLHYDLDDNNMLSGPDVVIPEFSLSSSETIIGNGLSVIDDTQTMTGTFILAPEFDYLLRFYLYWSMTDLPTVPCSSTLEAGGETVYDGIELILTAPPVPEPMTLSFLAIGGAAALRRRRR